MNVFTIGILFGILIGIFITIVGLLIAAAAGPNDEFDDMYEDIKDE